MWRPWVQSLEKEERHPDRQREKDRQRDTDRERKKMNRVMFGMKFLPWPPHHSGSTAKALGGHRSHEIWLCYVSNLIPDSAPATSPLGYFLVHQAPGPLLWRLPAWDTLPLIPAQLLFLLGLCSKFHPSKPFQYYTIFLNFFFFLVLWSLSSNLCNHFYYLFTMVSVRTDQVLLQ